MKKNRILLLFLIVGVVAASTWFIAANNLIGKFFDENDPDMSPTGVEIDRGEYLRLRNEQMDLLRGYDTAQQQSRTNAIREMEQSERELKARLLATDQPEAASWVSLGPAPIPNGNTSYSGRVSAIAVHPTNPDIVYLGTAQGGLYRTLNGGTTWTPLMDNALTIAIGAVAISPSDPTTVYVGTGESTLCGSGCYIGVGLYRITNAETTTPVLSEVMNKNAAGADVFTGRAISEVLVHPANPNIVFVATSAGVAGIGGVTTGATLPALGLYRTTNALDASPTFAKLNVGGVDRSITDLAMEPGNPNRIYVGLLGTSGTDGGVFSTANALDEAPAFSQLLSTSLTGNQSRVELAVNRVAGVTTVYAASGQGNGTIYKSVDSAPFTQVVNNSFCNPQCFYDIAIAVDPNDANRVFLGGSPNLPFGRSTNGGAGFINSSSTLHVDTQAIAVAPSNPNIVYFGSDGGIWKTMNVSATPIAWTTLNNSTLSATQFIGLSVHPSDRNYSLGGTQDNGTQFLAPDGLTWIRSDGGDGGFSVIDQTSPDTTNVVAYHTYFNQSGSQIGFARATSTVPPGDPNWIDFLGCGGTPNGINCGDPVLFYAPMAGGPPVAGSMGDTVYFGTNRLYRSTDRGATMTSVGFTGLSSRISAIAIASQNDDIRLVGTTGGGVFLSTAPGSTALTNVTGAIAASARYVGRTAIDPTDANKAYVALNGFGLTAGRHIWKTTNLLAPTPTWEPSGNGIPDTPVNAFVVDPLHPDTLYAGSDIGVFKSTDGGANWVPFNNGLPRVAVFGMAIQPTSRVLRISTHGRGMYDYNLAPERAVSDFDGDGKSDLAVFRPTDGNWYHQNSSNGANAGFGWGVSADRITPGDYDGDGKTDFAVFRPADGNWYINQSTAGITQTNFGLADDLPVQGDYDGDGKTDIAIFRPSDGNWYLLRSSAGLLAVNFGVSGDKPVPGDYDADGKTDIAVFRPSDGTWYLLRSTAGFTAMQYGISTDVPVPADYDADGKTDIAVYRDGPIGVWYLLRSRSGEIFQGWGATGDIPTPGDYDGDGKTDISVFRPSSGVWYRINSANSTFFGVQYGGNGDRPIPSAYIPLQ